MCRSRTREGLAARLPALSLALSLALLAVGCGAGNEAAASSAPGARPAASSSAAGTVPDACALITPADVERISGYPGAVRRETNSDSSCWMTVRESRLGVSVSIGVYVPTPFLGGRDVDLERGIRGRVSDAGWLNQIILPDQTSITLMIDGTALSPGPGKGDYRLELGDGRAVDLRDQYDAYARAVLSRLP